ncbi:hypothetical protein DRP04_01000 [Archaeoglobales archaeon]|nr:MAG: hypothetical protein DRP04_01000 [Archaeoglobales archaeon]
MASKAWLISVRKILEEWAACKIPTIQRGFVWNEERIKEFLDSIIKGYPVGSIILWTPKDEFPHAPLIDNLNKEPNNTYILDGQQRVTSLFLVYNGWKILRNGELIEVRPVYYDPKGNKLFVSSSKSAEKRGIDVSLILKAYSGDVEAYQELMVKYPNYAKTLGELARKILDYEIPYYELKDNISYDEVADIFVKVNSAGVKIENMHMFLSLFVGTLPQELSDVKNEIIAIHKKFGARESFGLTFETILRFVFHNLGVKQTQLSDNRKFKSAIKAVWDKYGANPSEIRDVVSCSERAIQLALNYLEQELGVVKTSFIPSQNALLPLFKYFYVNDYETPEKLPREERKHLAKLFILSSYVGRYSGNTKIDQDLGIITKGRFPIEQLIKRLEEDNHFTIKDFERDKNKFAEAIKVQGRKYIMLLIIALYKSHARDWTIQEKRVVENVKANDYEVHHIFPREYLSRFDIIDSDLVNDLGNLTIIDPYINKEIGDNEPLNYLSAYSEFLEEHFIPVEQELWRVENFENFLKKRREAIYDFILEEILV